jgi:hypothetical protein
MRLTRKSSFHAATFLAIRREVGDEAVLFQAPAQVGGRFRLVFDDQDSHVSP